MDIENSLFLQDFRGSIKAIPHKARLTLLHLSCLHLFCHIDQIFLDLHQYY